MKYLLLIGFLFSTGFAFSQSNGCMTKYVSKQKREIYVIAEVMPSFPGGQEKMEEYINEKFLCSDCEGQSGSIWVSLIVETDGTISNVEVIQNKYPKLDELAVSVVEGMPNWKRGSCDNKVVPVELMIPIKFYF